MKRVGDRGGCIVGGSVKADEEIDNIVTGDLIGVREVGVDLDEFG